MIYIRTQNTERSLRFSSILKMVHFKEKTSDRILNRKEITETESVRFWGISRFLSICNHVQNASFVCFWAFQRTSPILFHDHRTHLLNRFWLSDFLCLLKLSLFKWSFLTVNLSKKCFLHVDDGFRRQLMLMTNLRFWRPVIEVS